MKIFIESVYYSKEFFPTFGRIHTKSQTMHELKFISLLTHNKVLEVILGLLEKRLKVRNCFTSLEKKKKMRVTLAYELVIGPFSFLFSFNYQ